MANAVYNFFKQAVMLGSYNLQGGVAGTQAIWCILVGTLYAPNIDTDKYRSNVTNEITGSNYTAGGFALTSPLVTQDDTGNQGVLDASDVLIANVTFNTNPYGAVLYRSSGLGAASDPLICFVDFAATYPVTAGSFQIQWSASGILSLT